MNNFEKYIQENKKKLELDYVEPKLWLSIENKLLKKKNRRHRLYLRIASAAAIFLLGIMTASLFFLSDSNDIQSNLVKKYGIPNELPQSINVKIDQLSKAKIPIDRKEDFEILLNQLEFLDAQYQDYLQYIKANGYQKFIGEQILNYYKTKINLLDKIQSEIEKINYYENKYELESPTVGLDI